MKIFIAMITLSGLFISGVLWFTQSGNTLFSLAVDAFAGTVSFSCTTGFTIIANPNCSTIQAVVALYPLHKKAGLRYISVSTYQSVSGTGAKALSTLVSGSREILEGCKPQDGIVYPYPIAFKMLPHIGSFDDEGIRTTDRKSVV